MADFTKTITNQINVFGQEPATKWGQSFGYPYTMVWGTSYWGEGGYTIIFDISKVIGNSVTITDDYSLQLTKIVTNDFTITEDLSSENLANGDWNYVFVSDTIDAENRDVVSWSSGSASTSTFTCQAAGSTAWT